LFERMKSMPDGPPKQQLIDDMVKVVREDAPWTMGFFPYTSVAVQSWVHNNKPAILVRDQGRYLRLDVNQRVAKLAAWNQPVWWPAALLVVLAVGLLWGARWTLQRRERLNARGELLAKSAG
jgi:hypothetical protein